MAAGAGIGGAGWPHCLLACLLCLGMGGWGGIGGCLSGFGFGGDDGSRKGNVDGGQRGDEGYLNSHIAHCGWIMDGASRAILATLAGASDATTKKSRCVGRWCRFWGLAQTPPDGHQATFSGSENSSQLYGPGSRSAPVGAFIQSSVACCGGTRKSWTSGLLASCLFSARAAAKGKRGSIAPSCFWEIV